MRRRFISLSQVCAAVEVQAVVKSTLNSFYNSFDYEPFDGAHPPSGDNHPFQADRNRVLFSYPFRRLQSKTQVFQSGAYDFYRTRLTHTIEVARIARSICDHLYHSSHYLSDRFFIDPDLVEGIGMAHDIGHPPFGHIGERKLNNLMAPFGGFEGNAQTVRIITYHFYDRCNGPLGMNPSRAFLDGTMKYKSLYSELSRTGQESSSHPENHFLYDEQNTIRDWVHGGDTRVLQDPGSSPAALQSIECQIMDWADDAAYSLHDIVDGVNAGFLTPKRLEQWGSSADLTSSEMQQLERLLQAIHNDSLEADFARKIGATVRGCSLVEANHPLASITNRYRFALHVDPDVVAESRIHKRIAAEIIFRSSAIQQLEFKGGFILDRLFAAFLDSICRQNKRPQVLPDFVQQRIVRESDERNRTRVLCDYISGLTDGAAVRAYKRLYDADFSPLSEWL